MREELAGPPRPIRALWWDSGARGSVVALAPIWDPRWEELCTRFLCLSSLPCFIAAALISLEKRTMQSSCRSLAHPAVGWGFRCLLYHKEGRADSAASGAVLIQEPHFDSNCVLVQKCKIPCSNYLAAFFV